MFTQAETIEDETPKGTGLGLTLTRQFLAAMGGRIWVESEYGQGSTFFFTIPFTGEKEVKEEKPEAPEKKARVAPPLVSRKNKLVLAERSQI